MADPEVISTVQDMFDYHQLNEDQKAATQIVRGILKDAVLSIIAHVPPSPDRSAAIRKLREARMDCNSAITHGGKY